MSVNQWIGKGVFDFNIDDNMLERPRINQLFVKGIDFPLTIVHAPAGYGKTTSSLQFAKSLDFPLIYISLNDLDRNIEPGVLSPRRNFHFLPEYQKTMQLYNFLKVPFYIKLKWTETIGGFRVTKCKNAKHPLMCGRCVN